MSDETYDLSIKVRLGSAGRLELSLNNVPREQAQAMLDFCASSFGGRTPPPDCIGVLVAHCAAGDQPNG